MFIKIFNTIGNMEGIESFTATYLLFSVVFLVGSGIGFALSVAL
ncbi:hypothetical protein [Vibrio anguillarum]|nr:hypothetical protein [Vibrio anguillarum]